MISYLRNVKKKMNSLQINLSSASSFTRWYFSTAGLGTKWSVTVTYSVTKMKHNICNYMHLPKFYHYHVTHELHIHYVFYHIFVTAWFLTTLMKHKAKITVLGHSIPQELYATYTYSRCKVNKVFNFAFIDSPYNLFGVWWNSVSEIYTRKL